MWDYTLYDFKCPYCGHEYARTSGRGHNYEYKGEVYSSALNCPKCGKEYLYGKAEKGEPKFIKMPEDDSELKLHSVWMS